MYLCKLQVQWQFCVIFKCNMKIWNELTLFFLKLFLSSPSSPYVEEYIIHHRKEQIIEFFGFFFLNIVVLFNQNQSVKIYTKM